MVPGFDRRHSRLFREAECRKGEAPEEHQRCDPVAVGFQGEVTGIEEVELARLQISIVRFRPSRWK